MATRPVFIPAPLAKLLVREVPFEFQWFPGFAVSQKQKSIAALHAAAADRGLTPLLEISTKSPEKVGTRLSAFNLKVKVRDDIEVYLENVFQSSKVFERGGPYRDLLEVEPRDAKRDPRLRDSGKLVAFDFKEKRWPLEPKTLFYDWLYIGAIYPHREWLERLRKYRGYTDIEFNPERSINCQARSCALFTALMMAGKLDDAMSSPDEFESIVRHGVAIGPESKEPQGRLL